MSSLPLYQFRRSKTVFYYKTFWIFTVGCFWISILAWVFEYKKHFLSIISTYELLFLNYIKYFVVGPLLNKSDWILGFIMHTRLRIGLLMPLGIFFGLYTINARNTFVHFFVYSIYQMTNCLSSILYKLGTVHWNYPVICVISVVWCNSTLAGYPLSETNSAIYRQRSKRAWCVFSLMRPANQSRIVLALM